MGPTGRTMLSTGDCAVTMVIQQPAPNTEPTVASPQPAVNAAQTRAAIFLVLTVADGARHLERTRLTCGDLAKLVRAVSARDPDGHLSCAVGFGSAAWDRLFGEPRPALLHQFVELRSGQRVAPSTAGDLLFHIRAERVDLCYELGVQIMARLRESVTVIDETHGFRYFDDRDLTGFVDGTENPTGVAAVDATIVGEEDVAFAGGSYVMVQKYLHDHARWYALPTDVQERIIGRTKADDLELDPEHKPAFAHNELTTLIENGVEIKILRHNMPFGSLKMSATGSLRRKAPGSDRNQGLHFG